MMTISYRNNLMKSHGKTNSNWRLEKVQRNIRYHRFDQRHNEAEVLMNNKPEKDATFSQNYRPISMVLAREITRRPSRTRRIKKKALTELQIVRITKVSWTFSWQITHANHCRTK